MRGCDLVVVCSGTATLECGLLGLPMVVLYKASTITYAAAKILTNNIPFLALPNIIAKKQIVPELMQYKANPRDLTRESLNILLNSHVKQVMTQELNRVLKPLTVKGASDSAAKELLKVIYSSESSIHA